MRKDICWPDFPTHTMLRRASSLLGQQIVKREAAAPQIRCLSSPNGLGENMQEVKDSQQSQGFQDRSREVCGQQLAMSDEALCQVDSRSVSASGFYDIDGNAHLESVLQTNVPEPYEASVAAGNNLKEGVPEGLSDTVRGRGNRWMMTEDRLNS